MVEVEQEEFCASVYWDGTSYTGVWEVRVGPREQVSGSIKSPGEDGARNHVRCETSRRGFSVIRWEDGSTK